MEFQYDLELKKIEELIISKNKKRILIQMPEGMLDSPLKQIISRLSGLGVKIFVVGDASYGICDLAIDKAKFLQSDLLIHFGHTTFGFLDKIRSFKGTIDYLVIPAAIDSNLEKDFNMILEKLKEIKWNKIFLTATAQHLHSLVRLKSFLEDKEFEIVDESQILGCHIGTLRSKVEFDGIISLHAGNFHTHGILLNSSKPILQVDPYTSKISLHPFKERERIIKQRLGIITKVKVANNWGIISSTKIGQYNPSLIDIVEKTLLENSKLFFTITSENINIEVLSNMTWVDVWVNTACPRLIDDHERFNSPIISFKEFLYVFGELTWDDLLQEGFI